MLLDFSRNDYIILVLNFFILLAKHIVYIKKMKDNYTLILHFPNYLVSLNIF